LSANPQFIEESAYDLLQSVVYPPHFLTPDHRSGTDLLEHLGSSRYELLKIFKHDLFDASQVATPAAQAVQREIDAEYLKITVRNSRF